MDLNKLPKYRERVTIVPKRKKDETTAALIAQAMPHEALHKAITEVLVKGGAVMVGQTRDNAKLILTVYLDGDKEVEYCDDAQDAIDFLQNI